MDPDPGRALGGSSVRGHQLDCYRARAGLLPVPRVIVLTAADEMQEPCAFSQTLAQAHQGALGAKRVPSADDGLFFWI